MVKYITSYTLTTNFNIFTCKSAYHTLCILGIIQQLNVLQYNTLNSTLTYVTVSAKTRLVHTIKKNYSLSNICNIQGMDHQSFSLLRGGSRVWKEGGHLAEKKLKKKKKKKVTTIIASYPLLNILYHVCYVK